MMKSLYHNVRGEVVLRGAGINISLQVSDKIE
jgi:hypothetical protein